MNATTAAEHPEDLLLHKGQLLVAGEAWHDQALTSKTTDVKYDWLKFILDRA